MTLPDPAAPRKPRRGCLTSVIILLLVLAGAYSAGWFWLQREAEQRIDQTAASLRGRGYTVAWDQRTIGGYPFRLDVNFQNLRLREPSGWALAFPQLRTEAFVYAPLHWVADAPAGLTFTRPIGGPVRIQAQALRASLTGFREHPPRLSLEGRGLSFAPEPGARPFFLSNAQELQFHLRQGPNNEGGIFVSVTGARAQVDGLIGRVAQEGPVSLNLELIYSPAQALVGESWPAAVRNWMAAGGRATLRRGGLTAGRAQVVVTNSQPLTVDAEGRLVGSLTGTLRQAPQVVAAAGSSGVVPPQTAAVAGAAMAVASGGEDARLTLDFRDGRTWLGPIALTPAPRVY